MPPPPIKKIFQAMRHSKTVDCPYCASCKEIKMGDQGDGSSANAQWRELGLDFSHSNPGQADNAVTVSRINGWRQGSWYASLAPWHLLKAPLFLLRGSAHA
jgi:hypothetical protein